MRTGLVVLMLALAPAAVAQDLTPRQITQTYMQCSEQADAKCGRNTVYCRSYRRSYVKICLTEAGVPPDYIFMLLN